MPDYQFNELGHCQNPKQLVIKGKGSDQVVISTYACSNGRWNGVVSYRLPAERGYEPPADQGCFLTENDALQNAFARAMPLLRRSSSERSRIHPLISRLLSLQQQAGR